MQNRDEESPVVLSFRAERGISEILRFAQDDTHEQMADMTERVKIIGYRQPARGFKQAAAFLDTIVALRGNRPFIPKGYYRFKTFEEAQAWSIRMMARTGSTLSVER